MGGDGNDIVKGGAGDDLTEGGDGDDGVNGGLGNDTILGGDGNDFLEGAISNELMGADVDGADTMDGGDGNDLLSLGSGDISTGGEGEDQFFAGTWITGDAATITDYDASEDIIVINFDEAVSPDPDLTLGTETSGGVDYTVVSVDGHAVLRIAVPAGGTAPTASDIALVAAVW